jgi:hypothetical protein
MSYAGIASGLFDRGKRWLRKYGWFLIAIDFSVFLVIVCLTVIIR